MSEKSTTYRSLWQSTIALLSRARHSRIATGQELLAGCAILFLFLIFIDAVAWQWTLIALLLLAGCVAVRVHLRSPERDSDPTHNACATDSADIATLDLVTCNALLGGLPDAAVALDGGSLVVASNAIARATFPIAPGRHIAHVVRAPELLRAVDLALWRDEPHTLELRLPPPRERTLTAHITPLGGVYTSGRPALLIVLRDVTEQEQLSRMRADFVANASHELRTPLASLKGFIETLQGAAKSDPIARAQFLAIMEEQASRMSRLIDDLLSLSRIEMREHVAPSGQVDLSAVVSDVAKALRPIATDAGIDIDTSSIVAQTMVSGDQDELAQVVQNLMQNAIKYGRKGGHVEITIAPEGQRTVLSVKDDGIGVASQHLPRLTERFYRVSAKDSRERGGTGLGLAIVKHIVNRHRGELRIASELGQGSTFSVVLPVRSPV